MASGLLGDERGGVHGNCELSSVDLECFSLCVGYFVVLEVELGFSSYVSYLCVWVLVYGGLDVVIRLLGVASLFLWWGGRSQDTGKAPLLRVYDQNLSGVAHR